MNQTLCQGCQNDDGCYAESAGECANFDKAHAEEDLWEDCCPHCNFCGDKHISDCYYCNGGLDVNLVIITENADGTVNASVQMANGFAESIEGLHDVDTALDYGRMHLSYQTNKYIRR
jgi:hypothetical protein